MTQATIGWVPLEAASIPGHPLPQRITGRIAQLTPGECLLYSEHRIYGAFLPQHPYPPRSPGCTEPAFLSSCSGMAQESERQHGEEPGTLTWKGILMSSSKLPGSAPRKRMRSRSAVTEHEVTSPGPGPPLSTSGTLACGLPRVIRNGAVHTYTHSETCHEPLLPKAFPN